MVYDMRRTNNYNYYGEHTFSLRPTIQVQANEEGKKKIELEPLFYKCSWYRQFKNGRSNVADLLRPGLETVLIVHVQVVEVVKF